MKYITKLDAPNFYLEHTEGMTNWDEYHDLDKGKSKQKLRDHIIKKEQSNRCIYCECSVTVNTSHVEHVVPRSKDDNGVFDYSNLAVSCEGKTHNPPSDPKFYNCGHEKSSVYDASLFLSPLSEKDISEYFKFDLDTYKLICSGKDATRFTHTIDSTLKLNSTYLLKGRELRLRSFKKGLKKIKDLTQRKQKAHDFISKEEGAFISFLTYFVLHGEAR
ncbi:retron system putative HNH endonuclease [Vibrio sp. OPT20]|uniref:retron system putative HNH endonuclease n=1 Tax=Vibrio sp. OPT20 TaxID=2778642 RepID=UPI0018805FDB|nr:retron system putative HNH endonuclease [Vibrio sp. OPT20]MBE8567689.1 TIGR02646 family protein [Vibrio sp. OPT20]